MYNLTHDYIQWPHFKMIKQWKVPCCDESSRMAVAPRIVGCTSCPSSRGRAVGRCLRGWTSRARLASQFLDTFGQVENIGGWYENDMRMMRNAIRNSAQTSHDKPKFDRPIAVWSSECCQMDQQLQVDIFRRHGGFGIHIWSNHLVWSYSRYQIRQYNYTIVRRNISISS